MNTTSPDLSPAPEYKVGNENLCRITEKAAHQLGVLLKQSAKPEGALRIAVVGGGCSGLQYQMDLVEAPRAKDIMIESQRVKLIVDPRSALYLSGSILDYSDDLQSTGFTVVNPNAAATCSCGKSFTV